jgi:hypothetical protein
MQGWLHPEPRKKDKAALALPWKVSRMLDPDETNDLYWKIIWIIEPALRWHIPERHEPIREKAQRLAMEEAAKQKAKSILTELQQFNLVPSLLPSLTEP